MYFKCIQKVSKQKEMYSFILRSFHRRTRGGVEKDVLFACKP